MEKRPRNILGFIVLLLLLFVIVFLLFPFFFLKYLVTPLLSPFFPDLAPFDAQVTLKLNSAPSIIDIGNEIFVCENNKTLTYFNVTDPDGDSLDVRISPSFPFFVSPALTFKGNIITQIDLFSGILDKSYTDKSKGYKTYREILSADDGKLIDTKPVNITVVEINNAPNLSRIGVQTVWTKGDDSTFNYQAQVLDVEDGNQNSLNLNFSLLFLDNAPKLFGINNNGTMIFTPNVSLISAGVYNLSVYNISVCVQDKGIIETHSDIISICGQNGGPIKTCTSFSLTLTDANRAPVITSYNPTNLSFNASDMQRLYFNFTTRDPDGTFPDLYWYVDNDLVSFAGGSLYGELNYSFPCRTAGEHIVKADVTDGLLNTTLVWNITALFLECPINVAVGGPAGGGGGGSFSRCDVKWGCTDWGLCQNTEASFKDKLLSKEDYKIIKNNCKEFFLDDNCGFEVRNCQDVNMCNSTVLRPDEIGYCTFTTNPSCSDGLKNCHNGQCELLIDCGGSCNACPTCTDKIKDQGEEGLDCGGPCPLVCPPKPPILERIKAGYILIILIVLLLIGVLLQVIRIIRKRQKIESDFG